MTTDTHPSIDVRRCLTIHQPWAWLIVHGFKKVENRTWTVAWRGRLYIHAGKTPPRGLYETVKAFYEKHRPEVQFPGQEELKHGGIVGAVTLTGIVEASPDPSAMEGQNHWLLADPEVLPFEPCTGAQGIWIAGDQRRVMELPEGFTIKSTRLELAGGWGASLFRNGALVWQSAPCNSSGLARNFAMREAHRLNSLPTPPEALTDNCTCPHHDETP